MPQVFKNQPFVKRQWFQLKYPLPSCQGIIEFLVDIESAASCGYNL
jgi:hypothetical protein